MIEGLTNFADQAVILPIWLLAALGLIVIGWPRAALVWCLAVPAVLGVVLVGKIFTIACAGCVPAAIGLRSPSGHTASAAVVYGGLVTLLTRPSQPRLAALLWATGFAVVIGVSRLALGLHSVADVMVGAPIGILGAYALAVASGPAPQRFRLFPLFCATLLAAFLLLHGLHLRAEKEIGQFATRWGFLNICRLLR